MEDSEKLRALKKAYADIILNTAKEAAARIMVSEKKATRFQHELVSTKQDALQMLLRLKQMLDSKVNVAEMMSLNQQKKIEELEAQLEEAEEIVSDLRAELTETQAVLEKVTNNNMHSPVLQNIKGGLAAQKNCLQENRLDPSDGSVHNLQSDSVAIYDSGNSALNGTNDDSKLCVPHDHINNCYIDNPDFASIVIRRKETELYQNGCQRIHAFEKNLFDGDVSLSGNVDDIQNETSVRVNEDATTMVGKSGSHNVQNQTSVRVDEDKAMHVTTNSKADIIREMDKPDEVKVVNEVADPIEVSVPKKQATHMQIFRPFLYSETNKSSEFSCTKATMVEQSGSHSDTEKDEIFLEACNAWNKMKDDKELLNESNLTIQKCLSIENLDVPACRVDIEEAAKESSEKLDQKVSDFDKKVSNQSENGKFLKYTFQRKRKKEAVRVPDKNCSLANSSLNKKYEEKQNGHVEPQKSCTVTESMNKKCEEKQNGHVEPQKSCTVTESTNKKCEEKQNGHVEPQKSCTVTESANKKCEEKQNGHVEPQKSCTVTESTRDRRRLAQVARQILISLNFV
ncbi:hypothetical protein SESBI_13416 [Sesbania bispinosa]|nr:hypothetical protein SESBI_13416 [Sesbania bispinosa]